MAKCKDCIFKRIQYEESTLELPDGNYKRHVHLSICLNDNSMNHFKLFDPDVENKCDDIIV